MDLLGSILNSMDKPPTASEREKKATKELKEKLEREQLHEQKRRDHFKKKTVKQIGDFLAGTDKLIKFETMDKIYRAIVHDVATTAGLVTYSFGNDEEGTKHVIGYKKEHVPSDEELFFLRTGEQQQLVAVIETIDNNQSAGINTVPIADYREKYKHLIATQIAEPSAIKTEPDRRFGFVPSANKRDQRSIDETLQDMKTKKKIKVTEEQEEKG